MHGIVVRNSQLHPAPELQWRTAACCVLLGLQDYPEPSVRQLQRSGHVRSGTIRRRIHSAVVFHVISIARDRQLSLTDRRAAAEHVPCVINRERVPPPWTHQDHWSTTPVPLELTTLNTRQAEGPTGCHWNVNSIMCRHSSYNIGYNLLTLPALPSRYPPLFPPSKSVGSISTLDNFNLTVILKH